jgi:hypothetical protein
VPYDIVIFLLLVFGDSVKDSSTPYDYWMHISVKAHRFLQPVKAVLQKKDMMMSGEIIL